MRGILIPGVGGIVMLAAAVLLMAYSAPGAHATPGNHGRSGTVTTQSYVSKR